MAPKKNSFVHIYRIVAQIPPGRVATYGQIAALAGMPGAARVVGYALHSLPKGTDVPWHRVINSQGKISNLPDPLIGEVQRHLLESEGITFAGNQISLGDFLWAP